MGDFAVIFPGQGAQFVGMGAPFVEKSAAARDLYRKADDVLGYQLSKIILEGPEEELTLTRHCQPAIYLASTAMLAAFEEAGRFDPSGCRATAGLSLGEYTALHFAGALSFEDGLKLVAKRGALMQDASDAAPSGMISLLGADQALAEKVARAAAGDDVLSVANILSPKQVVLSGSRAACERVPQIAKSMGVRRALPLKVAGAFHSALMQPAADALKEALAKVDLRPARIPVYVNAEARPLTEPAALRAALERQIVEPVLWLESMRRMREDGVDRFLEPGPGRVLTGLLRKIDPEAASENLDALED